MRGLPPSQCASTHLKQYKELISTTSMLTIMTVYIFRSFRHLFFLNFHCRNSMIFWSHTEGYTSSIYQASLFGGTEELLVDNNLLVVGTKLDVLYSSDCSRLFKVFYMLLNKPL